MIICCLNNDINFVPVTGKFVKGDSTSRGTSCSPGRTERSLICSKSSSLDLNTNVVLIYGWIIVLMCCSISWVTVPVILIMGLKWGTSCTEVGFRATYICHTACTLRKRSQQHKYSISAIQKHYINDHLLSRVPVNFSDNFILLQNFPDICELRIEEAILIQEKLPIINVKYNDMYNSLNLYK